MVNMIYYVARHGQDLDNANGILNGRRNQPLTDVGRQQARAVAVNMRQAGFVLPGSSRVHSTAHMTALGGIYSSPLLRAYETAEIFSEILSEREGDASCNRTEVQILDDLIERDFGLMTGLPISSILELCDPNDVFITEKINYFLDCQGAETFPDLVLRAKRLLTRIENETSKANDEEDQSESKSILLVTHGDFGKTLYAAYYDLDWKAVLGQFHFGNSEVLVLSKDSSSTKAHLFETLQFNS